MCGDLHRCSELEPGDLCLRRDGQTAEFIGISKLVGLDCDCYVFCSRKGPFSVYESGLYINEETPHPADIIWFVRDAMMETEAAMYEYE